MKKSILLSLSIGLLLAAAPAQAKDKVISPTQLPQASLSFIDEYFKGSEVKTATKDADFLSVEYEVMLADNTSIEFNKKGEWKEVKNKTAGISPSFIPEKISQYIKANYKDAKIVKIDKNRSTYEVELDNSLELVFTLNGTFSRIDD